MKYFIIQMSHYGIFLGVLLMSIMGCETGIRPPDNIIQFEASELGIATDEESITIKISFSRGIDNADSVLVTLTPSPDMKYDEYFVTQPPMSLITNRVRIDMAKGANEATFTVDKKEGIALAGSEYITLDIYYIPRGTVLGTRKTLQLSFSSIVATKVAMDPDVGGVEHPNTVFIDLSANRQVSVPRDSWDLRFYAGEGVYRVGINFTLSDMTAIPIEKNRLVDVTPADTVGFAKRVVFRSFDSDATERAQWVDDPSGDITKTAISAIAENDDQNKVYIVSRGIKSDGTPRGWKKIRIVRNGDDYLLRHADIAETTAIQEIRIGRADENDYHFSYVDFDEGLVDVEPIKQRWDIAYTSFVNKFPFMDDGEVPILFRDFVIQNPYEVRSAEVITTNEDTPSFEDVTPQDLESITFSSDRGAIGSNWRVGGGPTSQPVVKTDRYYLVEDAQKNVYKLRFTALSQDGQRGRPKMEYELVREGGK